MSYTNGELRQMLAPVLEMNPDDIACAVIVIQTKDDYIKSHAMFSDHSNIMKDRLIHTTMLAGGIASIAAETLMELRNAT